MLIINTYCVHLSICKFILKNTTFYTTFIKLLLKKNGSVFLFKNFRN